MTDKHAPWTEFFDNEYDRIHKWAQARMGQQVRAHHGASDIVGTAIGRIVRAGTEDLPTDLASLVAIVRKRIVWAIIDKSRRPDTQRVSSVAPEDIERLFETPLEECDRDDLERLDAALDALTVDERQLVVLRYEWGFTYRELAEEIPGMTESRARHACDQALQLLRREYARRG